MIKIVLQNKSVYLAESIDRLKMETGNTLLVLIFPIKDEFEAQISKMRKDFCKENLDGAIIDHNIYENVDLSLIFMQITEEIRMLQIHLIV